MTGMLTIPKATNTSGIIRCEPARVYVAGRRRRDLEVLSWRSLSGYPFADAVIAKRLPRILAGGARMEDVSSLPAVGDSVLIRAATDFGAGGFPARVVAHRSEFSRDAERLVAVVEHALAAALDEAVGHRWQLGDVGPVKATGAQVRFNASGQLWASAQTHSINGRQCRVFSAGADAIRWTVADALAYLMAAYVPADVETPGPEELDSLAGDVDVGEMSVTHLAAWEALAKVARAGGLAMTHARSGLGVVFYRPGIQGRPRRVRLQCAGATATSGESNLWRGSIVVRRRPSNPPVLALGRHKRYESTFNLQPGWYDGDETSRWRDFVRGEGDYWPGNRNVYRKWVLNEHDWYGGSPWFMDVHDFSDISADDFHLRVPRSFEPCLSADGAGKSYGVFVQFRCSQDDDWRAWGGPVEVARDECAIYLGGDGLPGEYFRAAVEGTAEVRVTATVEADSRITAEIPGSANLPRRIIDLSANADWAQVHSSSTFYQQGVAAGERDDTDKLLACAQRYAQNAAGAMEAELTLPWPDTSYGVGDLIERIDGRGLDLRTSPLTAPHVRSVRHEFGESQTTTLVVSG